MLLAALLWLSFSASCYAAPTITTYNPAQASTTLATDGAIVLTFSAPVQQGTGDITITKLASSCAISGDAADVQAIVISSSHFDVNNPAVVSFTPSPLAVGSQYRVMIPSGVITDTSTPPIAFAGLADHMYEFTVAAAAGHPTITTYSPAQAATQVAENANIVLTFSAAITAGSGDILIKKLDSSGIPVSGATQIIAIAIATIAGQDLTINPANNLDPGTTYRVVIPSTAVARVINFIGTIPFAGLACTTYQFTTSWAGCSNPATDPVMTWAAQRAPEVAYTVPYNTMFSDLYSRRRQGNPVLAPVYPSGYTVSWNSVAYGGGTYVAVANTGGHGIISSPDGKRWNARSVGAYIHRILTSVVYGDSKFVAVGRAFPGVNDNTVNTQGAVAQHCLVESADGVIWSQNAGVELNSWESVTYGDNKYVAVASTGTHRVMSSTDGTAWTGHLAPGNTAWVAITWGNPGGAGTFVAVAPGAVMYSTNGNTWISGTPAATDTLWTSVAWGNDKYIVVARNSDGIMSSVDGITWTSHSGVTANPSWNAVAFGDGRFVAVSESGCGRAMTSTDGATWSLLWAAEAI